MESETEKGDRIVKYYVDAGAEKSGDGSCAYPFRDIGEAAAVALPGDEVIVTPGIYRESVNPVNGGTEQARIVYRSQIKGAAVITGAEQVKNWEYCRDNVWIARIPNGLFTDRNPYRTLVYGDWYEAAKTAHTGDVFLNEKSMYEVPELEKVFHPEKSAASWEPEFFCLHMVYGTGFRQRRDSDLCKLSGKGSQQGERGDQRPEKLFLSGTGGRRLHHPVRVYGAAGCHTVGAADGIPGRDDRSPLVQRVDHRGL